jgi:hypothetical protein
MPVTLLLQHALNELANLQSSEVFLVRDLFKGYEWKRIPKSDRLKLGSMFLASITSQGAGYKVRPLGKTTANQQEYEMV